MYKWFNKKYDNLVSIIASKSLALAQLKQHFVCNLWSIMSGRRSHGGSAGGGKRGSGVQYQRNEPSFLRKLKEQIGYREAVPTLDDKQPDLKNQDSDEGKDDIEKDDEKPVVVVLKEGDLTAEEAQAEAEKTAQGIS